MNRKEREAYQKEEYKKWYVLNLNSTQICKKCGINKKISLFLSNYSHRFICKECHKNRTNNWRNDNPGLAVQIKRRGFNKSADLIKSLKEKDQCGKCGGVFPYYVLDFHHIHSKDVAVSKLYEKSQDRIRNEVSKCILICANCHRGITQEPSVVPVTTLNLFRTKIPDEIPLEDHSESKKCASCLVYKNTLNFTKLKTGKFHSYCKKCLKNKNASYGVGRKTSDRPAKTFVNDYKINNPCVDCGIKFPYWVTDFDHVTGFKTSNISILRNSSLTRVMEEVKNCELICANCHRIRTHKRRGLKKETLSESETYTKYSDELKLLRNVTSRISNQVTAKEFLDKFHYAGYGRPASIIYEARFEESTVAIAKFTPVIRQEVATSIGLNPEDVIELDRLCVDPSYQVKNLVSRFLSLTIKNIKKDYPSFRYLVSFADMAQGHSGTVYRASNWKEIGVSASSYYYRDTLGNRLNKKTVYNKAVAKGLSEAEYVSSLEYEKIRTPGKFKFIYELR